MTRRQWFSLTALGFGVTLLAVHWVRSPGYMDADYYYATAVELASGRGFNEPFLWNYLDDPSGIPHPSHLYWMPLVTGLAAGSMWFFGVNFRAAQLPFIALSMGLPLLAAAICWRLTENRSWTWRAGVFAVFSGFYLPYWVTTDAFSAYAFVGGLALWGMARASRNGSLPLWFGLGALIGVGNLLRADGMLLFIPALLAVLWSPGRRFQAVGALALGYLLVVSPWWYRNWSLTGNPLGVSGNRSLWLSTYNDFFSYPASVLTSERWLASGLGSILSARLSALGTNLQRLVAENGLVFLGPFIIVGGIQLWNRTVVRLAFIYLLVLLGAMSFVFPFAGANGAFFHSGTAVMPVLWALAPVGLDKAIEWGARHRRWDLRQARVVLGLGAMMLAVTLTSGLFWMRVVGRVPDERPRWGAGDRIYQGVGERLKALGPSPGRVAVNNPPGFYLATGLEAIVIPNGDLETLRKAVERYTVSWVVLDINHPQGLTELYTDPTAVDWLGLVESVDGGDGRPVLLLKVR